MADISESALATALAKVVEIIPDHPRIQTCKCDVSKESEVAAMVDRLDSWGGVDIMFNNAGIMHANDADAIDTPEKIWDLTQAINVKGVWFGSKHALLSLRKHKKTKGSIINTASVVALTGSATPQLAYTASKGAVLAMTRELAIVHAKEGFRFNSLCPAPLKYVHSLAIISLDLLKTQIYIFCVRCQQPKLTTLQPYSTPLLQDWLGDDAAKRHRREVHFPTGRFGEAIEQAHAVVFLASDESSFVNGTDFVVDGGLTKVTFPSPYFFWAQRWRCTQRPDISTNPNLTKPICCVNRHMLHLKVHQHRPH